MFWEFPLKIQAWSSEAQDWYIKEFATKKELTAYIEAQFPEEPQYYRLKNTSKWQETGQHYADTQKMSGKADFKGGRYHNFIHNSAKHKKWKETEKDRVLNGVIYDNIYIPPFYYWYLNFCPIYNDLAKKKQFADVWDGDLWYMQYCMLAILKGKHIGGVKGRQKGYSFKHMAILYWSYCWFESSVNTVGAYDEKLVKKSWRYLEGYRGHINTATTWRRGPSIPKSLEWYENQLDENGDPQGLQSKLAGVTFKQNPENDVGGVQTFFNYEEPGVSPTILETMEFIRPAVEKGSVTTGIIIACGSVGELDDAEGIKTIFYNPRDYNFLPVKNVWDKDKLGEECCIFISEAYNMIGTDEEGLIEEGRPFMDKDGNSDVEFALQWIEKKKEQLKNSKKKSHLKQLALSQKCTSPSEAFAERNNSEWPLAKLKAQQERIKIKQEKNLWDFKPLKGLFEEKEGRVILNQNPEGGLPREHGYPIDPTWEDKRGVWTIYGPLPETVPEMYTFFACVDSVEAEETETSESVASVDIYMAPIMVFDQDGKLLRVEGDKLYATYRGRFKGPNQTNEQMWYGIKLFNAWTYPERNKPNFINYMKTHGRAERYLAKESDVPFLKDLNIKNGNFASNSKYGFYKGDNTEIWKHFKSAGKEYFFSEYGRNDTTDYVYTGIDRIDDYWLLEEFIQHVEGKGNYDRMISFLGALFIAKVYQQQQFIKKKIEGQKKQEEKEPVIRQPRSMISGTMNTRNFGYKGKPKSMI